MTVEEPNKPPKADRPVLSCGKPAPLLGQHANPADRPVEELLYEINMARRLSEEHHRQWTKRFMIGVAILLSLGGMLLFDALWRTH